MLEMYPPYAFEAYVDEFCGPADGARDYASMLDVLWASPHALQVPPTETNSTWHPTPTPTLDAIAPYATMPDYHQLMAAFMDDLDACSSSSCSSSSPSPRSPLSLNAEDYRIASSPALPFTLGGFDAAHPDRVAQKSCVCMPKTPPEVVRPQVGSVKMKLASAKRREAPANFACPLFECGSTFTKKHNLESKSTAFRYLRTELCKY